MHRLARVVAGASDWSVVRVSGVGSDPAVHTGGFGSEGRRVVVAVAGNRNRVGKDRISRAIGVVRPVEVKDDLSPGEWPEESTALSVIASPRRTSGEACVVRTGVALTTSYSIDAVPTRPSSAVAVTT